MAIEYAAAYQLGAGGTAEVLADALLKGLLAAHHGGAVPSAAAWTPAEFIEQTQARSCWSAWPSSHVILSPDALPMESCMWAPHS